MGWKGRSPGLGRVPHILATDGHTGWPANARSLQGDNLDPLRIGVDLMAKVAATRPPHAGWDASGNSGGGKRVLAAVAVKEKMNLIVENENSVRFYTSLLDVARWLDFDLEDFDWHLSDIDGGWPGIPDPCWITGYGLVEKLREYDYQFIWAVLSVFPKGSEPRLDPEPYADGNTSFWNGNSKKQLPGAIFEIVCWDSSATLFIGLPEDLATNALKNIPGIKKLDNSVVDPI